jgi:hypothetical protein|tara:strand:- start:56 stop:226 length:171 start_codon:yes stop_codon:yes gene_type:complete
MDFIAAGRERAAGALRFEGAAAAAPVQAVHRCLLADLRRWLLLNAVDGFSVKHSLH